MIYTVRTATDPLLFAGGLRSAVAVYGSQPIHSVKTSPLDLRGERFYTSSRPTRGTVPKTELLQGTLDLLILKILTLGPNHGWGISNRIRQISLEGLNVSQGSLYPALHRLELRGDVESEMTPSENNRRARVYRLTRAGHRRLESENASWERFVLSMGRILNAQ